MIEEIHGTLEFYEKAESVRWVNTVSSEIVIRTDPYRLRIGLNNLISNAVKYSDLSKTDPFLKISADTVGSKLKIAIEDNGIGIPTDKLPNLFRMFYRATTKESGSGLGLYIAKDAIEKLKGSVEVHSVYDVGTTFTISLPI